MGRVVATCASVATVAGCALLVVQLSNAGHVSDGQHSPVALPTAAATRSFSYVPWTPAVTTDASSTTASTVPRPSTTTSAVGSASAPSTSGQPARPANAVVSNTPRPAPPPVQATSAPSVPAVRGQALPVSGSTSGANEVITVLAAHSWSTTATLQAWDRAPGGGWIARSGTILAHVGSQGLTTAPSESLSATPIGSFTLTQAFGADSNPGTPLPYFQTTLADWWISQAGPLYNTHQHCAAGCPFDTTNSPSNPNEHLVTETPYYNYAVVIDYNTRNSPTGVQQGKGSAFFLHVTDGTATAGCVAIPQSTLTAIMRWLTPAAHPRILIGVAG
jgi:L,D-peptidoglycan transpeptidase YkuD (ErfK/YbiS/YcfS/YnhG family)